MTLRQYLFHSQRGKCHYCNVQMARKVKEKYFVTEDHIIPKSAGGSDMIGNLVGACNVCNNMRGSIPYQVFKTFIQIHGNEKPIKEVLKSLSMEEYYRHKDMYDVVRRSHFQSHLSVEYRDVMPSLFARRPYLNETRRRLRRREVV